jgi:hypothetical protein
MSDFAPNAAVVRIDNARQAAMLLRQHTPPTNFKPGEFTALGWRRMRRLAKD